MEAQSEHFNSCDLPQFCPSAALLQHILWICDPTRMKRWQTWSWWDHLHIYVCVYMCACIHTYVCDNVCVRVLVCGSMLCESFVCVTVYACVYLHTHKIWRHTLLYAHVGLYLMNCQELSRLSAHRIQQCRLLYTRKVFNIDYLTFVVDRLFSVHRCSASLPCTLGLHYGYVTTIMKWYGSLQCTVQYCKSL